MWELEPDKMTEMRGWTLFASLPVLTFKILKRDLLHKVFMMYHEDMQRSSLGYVNKLCFPSTTGSSAIPELWSREEGNFKYAPKSDEQVPSLCY